mmetsp:Transcript_10627/g.31664  ORF Transcript_10627/g.31664 Transcript_10627/m.31664 type:complete len:246 (-) Transcript_10627:364-1101(-)
MVGCRMMKLRCSGVTSSQAIWVSGTCLRWNQLTNMSEETPFGSTAALAFLFSAVFRGVLLSSPENLLIMADQPSFSSFCGLASKTLVTRPLPSSFFSLWKILLMSPGSSAFFSSLWNTLLIQRPPSLFFSAADFASAFSSLWNILLMKLPPSLPLSAASAAVAGAFAVSVAGGGALAASAGPVEEALPLSTTRPCPTSPRAMTAARRPAPPLATSTSTSTCKQPSCTTRFVLCTRTRCCTVASLT